jgi:hypothetical protein
MRGWEGQMQRERERERVAEGWRGGMRLGLWD